MKNIILLISILSVNAMQANAGQEKYITPLDVNIRNYQVFVDQLKKDLPIGTSMQQVMKYLSVRNIQYSNVLDDEGCVKVMIKKVDSSLFFFKTDLQIKIFASGDGRVSEIESTLVETAF